MTRPPRVTAIEPLSPGFRLIDLEGDALRNVTWAAGQKVQIAVGMGLAARIYTPMLWDADRGRTRILAHSLGGGPGSRWANALRADDPCQFLGPRRSLDLDGPGAPLVLCGDETAFGLGGSVDPHALSRRLASPATLTIASPPINYRTDSYSGSTIRYCTAPKSVRRCATYSMTTIV